jgi:hypothetical protein
VDNIPYGLFYFTFVVSVDKLKITGGRPGSLIREAVKAAVIIRALITYQMHVGRFRRVKTADHLLLRAVQRFEFLLEKAAKLIAFTLREGAGNEPVSAVREGFDQRAVFFGRIPYLKKLVLVDTAEDKLAGNGAC